MLGKLIKHEYIYLLKRFSIIYVVYLCSALLLKLLSLFDVEYSADNPLYYTYSSVLFITSSVFVILTSALAFLTIADNIRRFKKNMFSDEGYLTNTLPVTATQHIVAKLIAGATNYLVSFLCLFLGFFIVVQSEVIEILSLFKEMFEELEVSQIICVLLLSLSVYIAFMLFGYFVSALGSMANSKWLVGAAVTIAAFFFVTTAVSWIYSGLMLSNIESVEAVMLVFTAFFAACAAVFYLLTVNIIKKHLNLQ